MADLLCTTLPWRGGSGMHMARGTAPHAWRCDTSCHAPMPPQSTMVRRVAAMPGDELVAHEGEEHEETFVVPQASSRCAMQALCTMGSMCRLSGGQLLGGNAAPALAAQLAAYSSCTAPCWLPTPMLCLPCHAAPSLCSAGPLLGAGRQQAARAAARDRQPQLRPAAAGQCRGQVRLRCGCHCRRGMDEQPASAAAHCRCSGVCTLSGRSPAPVLPHSPPRRILYAARSETDHGPVENSAEGMEADAPVMEAELDLERLCNE